MTNSDLPTESGEPRATAATTTTAGSPTELPLAIGRYRVVRLLGTGGFGTVYLTQDTELERLVAVKVPHPERLAKSGDEERYIVEARTVASLDHPAIVPVYDVVRNDEHRIFVVSKFIEGSDLAHWLKQRRPGPRRAAQWIITVAEALHYAHTKGLVHRDIKPANLLIDAEERIYITDLGLALREEDFGRPSGRGRAGTPAYMSPEQARGEGHRVDGRSDIFSMGVVLYELLTGRRPFAAPERAELLELIISGEPRPLRQLDDSIPKELERICFKALSKRASERYSTALDFAEDLRCSLLEGPTPSAGSSEPSRGHQSSGELRDGVPPSSESKPASADQPSLRVVPKGLHSFDGSDADFFLELLPGPRDRDGLPESIRFWKTRLEEREPDRTFSVGVLCGPSGSGKSSLVKAGLLPRVARHVTFVYAEAAAGQLENRLLHGIHQRWPDLPSERGLADTVAILRRRLTMGGEQKAVLVIDQFEQWLHGQSEIEESQLVQALRHCDGGHVQCLLLVRDDFWMGISRFMHEVEVPLAEGVNLATVDLFDLRHAKRVLAAFGRAFGWLPENKEAITRAQDNFLEQAVTDLARDGKVIPVRLALLAEMAKSRPWTLNTLKELGGAAGVGARFLEETFSAPTAPPRYRSCQQRARVVLQSLLPEQSATIKGRSRTVAELQEAVGLARRPREFEELLRMLDGELRLITPADSSEDGDADATGKSTPGDNAKAYQLTHDYLVPALREWLTRKQQETPRGRAELRLADCGSLWQSKPDDRHLPGWWEYVSIRSRTGKSQWTEPQKQMMRRASRYYGLRAGLSTLLVTCAVVGALAWRSRSEALAGYDQLKTASSSALPLVIARLDEHPYWVRSKLRADFEKYRQSGNDWIYALALLDEDKSRYFPIIREAILNAEQPLQVVQPARLLMMRLPGYAPGEEPSKEAESAKLVDLSDALPVPKYNVPASQQFWQKIVAEFWSVANNEQASPARRLRAGAVLSEYDPQNPSWPEIAPFMTEQLFRENRLEALEWAWSFQAVGKSMLKPLAAIAADANRPASDRELAAELVAQFASRDPQVLIDTLAQAEPRQFPSLFDALEPHRDQIRDKLETILVETLPNNASPEKRSAFALRRANAALALARLDRPEVLWPLLKLSDDPSTRSILVQRMIPLGVDPQLLIQQLSKEPDVTIRRALLLSLDRLPASAAGGQTQELIDEVVEQFRSDPDPGLHSAAAWLLRRWGQLPRLRQLESEIVSDAPPSNQNWYINREGHTLAITTGPVEFRMGSPGLPNPEIGRSNDEAIHRRKIGRSFALATTEVTDEQFRRFLKANPSVKQQRESKQVDDPTVPINHVTWYEAAQYCRWLSELEGLNEDQMVYPAIADIKSGMTPPADYLERSGYRLPEEAEWEFACRAGTTTSHSFGGAVELLGDYAWFAGNAPARPQPVGLLKPNDLGLFDVHGNLAEWCHGTYFYFFGRGTQDVGDFVPLSDTSSRMLRGGSFASPAYLVRSADRLGYQPLFHFNYLGFRIARTIKAAEAAK